MKSPFTILQFFAVSLLMFTAETLSATTLNIVYIGDSITAGAGLHLKEGDMAPPAACSVALRNSGFEVYDSNQGHSGHTTKDFLPDLSPNPKSDFSKAKAAADQLIAAHEGQLVFSIMLGTNDSAERGPNGAPLPPEGCQANLKTIIDRLLEDYPHCKVIIQHPIWYSPSTHNSSEYGAKGLARLKSYDPVIESLVKEYAKATPGAVFVGDRDAFAHFEAHFIELIRAEKGVDGTFYLHPNKEGALRLGQFWAKAIKEIIPSAR